MQSQLVHSLTRYTMVKYWVLKCANIALTCQYCIAISLLAKKLQYLPILFSIEKKLLNPTNVRSYTIVYWIFVTL